MAVEFYQQERVGLFFAACLTQTSKITVTCQKSVKQNERDSCYLPKVSKMNFNFELLKVSKMTNLKISISPATRKLETSNLDSR